MAVNFKQENFAPWKKLVQIGTARYALTPLYFLRNTLKVTGRENVVKGEPFLIVANHLSYWDPPVLVIACDTPMGFIAKQELFGDAKFSWLIEFYGAISINRSKPELSAIKSVRQIVKAGWSVAMFIEGTRNSHPGILGRPHLGAAYFAKTNKLRILPVGLLGTNNYFKHAEARIGKPFEASEDLEETTWQIMDILSQLTGFSIGERKIECAS